MAVPAAQKRVAELREKIEKANYEYYILDQPKLADEAYDALLRELQQLEEANLEPVTPESSTQRVSGATSTRLAPVERRTPVLVLFNGFGGAELRATG